MRKQETSMDQPYPLGFSIRSYGKSPNFSPMISRAHCDFSYVTFHKKVMPGDAWMRKG